MAEASQAASPQTTVIRPSSRARSRDATRRRVGNWAAAGILAVLGLGSGVSALADGFYDLTVWGPITVGMAALAVAGAAVTAARPRLAPALAVAGLTGLWLWSWVSASWAESTDQALVTAGRWALYAAMLTALLLLARSERERWIPMIFATIGVLVAAGWVDRYLAHPRGKRRINFFLSELFWPTDHPNNEFNFWVTQKTAALYLTNALRITRRWSRIYTLGWYALYDDPPNAQGDEVNRGLLTFRGRKKPAYRAYKRG